MSIEVVETHIIFSNIRDKEALKDSVEEYIESQDYVSVMDEGYIVQEGNKVEVKFDAIIGYPLSNWCEFVEGLEELGYDIKIIDFVL